MPMVKFSGKFKNTNLGEKCGVTHFYWEGYDVDAVRKSKKILKLNKQLKKDVTDQISIKSLIYPFTCGENM